MAKVLPKSARSLPTAAEGEGRRKIGKAERKIAGALLWLNDEHPTPAKVAFYSGYSVKCSSFANALGTIRSTGFAQGWRLKQEGVDMVGDIGPKPTGQELRNWLRSKLGQAENTLLDTLIEAGGARLMNEDLAPAARYSVTSSSFANALGTLWTIEPSEGYERDGRTRASDVLLE